MSIGKSELDKPLILASVVANFLTLLKVYGIAVGLWVILGVYGCILLLLLGIGYTMRSMGSLEYNNKLGNSQNAEILEILKNTREIKEKL